MSPPPPKASLTVNLIQALCAVVLGNVFYFFLGPAFHLPPHHPFQFDWGLVVDFWLCVVVYGFIRTARKWK